MFRHRSTTASGQPFDEAIIEAVWEKAQDSPQHHPLRLDAFGALIWREGYGNTNSKFGWEIDHIKPVSEGGGDELENLQPLQWENNRSKGDTLVSSKQTLDTGSATQGYSSAA
jgi:hypothetical protein